VGDGNLLFPSVKGAERKLFMT